VGFCEDGAVDVSCEVARLDEVVLFCALRSEDIRAIKSNHKGEVGTEYSKHEEGDKCSPVFVAVVGNEVN
jgi:hypothetical protein